MSAVRRALFRLLFPREAARLALLEREGEFLVESAEVHDWRLDRLEQVPTGDDYNDLMGLIRAFANRIEEG